MVQHARIQCTIWLLLSISFFTSLQALAHPMPSSIVNLSVLPNNLLGEARMPLIDLQNATGNNDNESTYNKQYLREYFKQHIAVTTNGIPWHTIIDSINFTEENDAVIGNYKEAIVYFAVVPPNTKFLREFNFNYTVIIHQVITHSILVFLKYDWLNGVHGMEKSIPLGVIALNIPSGVVQPLKVSLEEGSWIKGIKSMCILGMQHIVEGTDHLLFIIVLLLPAMLAVNGKNWGAYAGFGKGLVKLAKVITAFTIGHSISLLLGATSLVIMPQRPVEIIIAISILVSAIHAIRPVFYGREMQVAASFGIIHGLAFSTVLTNFHLTGIPLMVSIFSFNIGIELVQLAIILVIAPILFLLSKSPNYKYIKAIFAVVAIMASLGWIVERITGNENAITSFITSVLPFK